MKTQTDTIYSEVKTKIDVYKHKLQAQPIVENFGQDEVQRVKDFAKRLLRESSYAKNSIERKKVQKLVNQFENWCMTYTGE